MSSDEDKDDEMVSQMTPDEEAAHIAMTTPSRAKMYLTSMHRGLTRMEHIRDYLRYALTIVTDEQTPFLVWVPSTRNKTEETVYFERHSDNNKIKLTLGSITTANCRLYYRLVFAWLRRFTSLTPPVKLYQTVYDHPRSDARKVLKAQNAYDRNRKMDSKRGTWKSGGGVRQPTTPLMMVVPSMTEEIDITNDDDVESSIRLALMGWNNAIKLKGSTLQLPQAMLMFTNDMDRIVAYKFVHLLARILTYLHAGGHTNELDTFIHKVIKRTDYRKVYSDASNFLSVTTKRYIEHRRSVIQFSL
jgi:hypothetical protein